MQLIYTCPNCGHDLQDICLTSNPPINKKVCHYCGWSVEEPQENIVRIPYGNENDIQPSEIFDFVGFIHALRTDDN